MCHNATLLRCHKLGKMKKFLLIKYLLIFSVLPSVFVDAEDLTNSKGIVDEEISAETTDETLLEELGYFFGYSFGKTLKEGGNVDVNLDSLRRGLVDSINSERPDLTSEQQERVIAAVRKRQQDMVKKKESDANRAVIENLEKAKVFLSENKSKPNIKTTSSGLQYERLLKGKGARPHLDATVVVHYEGKLTNGNIFDSSIKRGIPAVFGLTQVIRGWTEGLQLMKVGGKTRFFIPPELAYGPGGTRGVPPNSVLVFEVELIEIK